MINFPIVPRCHFRAPVDVDLARGLNSQTVSVSSDLDRRADNPSRQSSAVAGGGELTENDRRPIRSENGRRDGRYYCCRHHRRRNGKLVVWLASSESQPATSVNCYPSVAGCKLPFASIQTRREAPDNDVSRHSLTSTKADRESQCALTHYGTTDLQG